MRIWIVICSLVPLWISSQTTAPIVQQVLPSYSWITTSGQSNFTEEESGIFPTDVLPSSPVPRPSSLVPRPSSLLSPVQQFYLPPSDFRSFYSVRSPYTLLHARFGMGNEQFFDGVHSQNPSPRTNFTVAVLRNNGEGMYLRQKFFYERYAITFYHRPKNERYALSFSGSYLSSKNEENGGLDDVSLFTDNVFSNRKLFPVLLNNASTKTRSRHIRVDQYFFFSKDSLWNVKRNGGQIRVGVFASDRFRTYADDAPPSTFYPNFFLDSTRTRDSLSFSKLGADLGLSFPVKKWAVEIVGTGQYSDYYNFGFDSLMMDIGAGGSVRKDTSIVLKGNYILNGPSAGNSLLSLYVSDLIRSLGKDSAKFGIGIFASSVSSLSPLIYSYYQSNHYSWENVLSKDFSRQTHTTLQTILTLQTLRTQIKLGYEKLQGYTFLSNGGNPKWANNIDWINIEAATKLHGKQWNVEFQFTYRSTEDTLLPVPKLKGDMQLYWEKKYSSGKISLQLGGAATYLGEYFPGAYLPSLGMYDLSNRIHAGDYIYPALFVNLNVGPAKIYVRADHVTSGLFGHQYFVAENYPGPDRIIRAGVRWEFYD